MSKRIISLLLVCIMILFYFPQPVELQAEESETQSSLQERAAPAVAEKLEIGPADTVSLGSTVTLQGYASGDAAEGTVYRYIYYDGSTWLEISRSTSPEPAEWVPDRPGDYLVAFQVQSSGQETNAFGNLHVQDPYFRLQGISAASSEDGGVVIRPLYETNENASDISFSYLLYDLGTQIWYTIQTDTGDSCIWYPEREGDYWLHVIARNAEGTEVSSTIGYHVSGAKVTGISLDKGSTQVWNTTVTLTGSVDNPLGQQLVYEYLAYNGEYWTSLYKDTELKSIEYKAGGPGSYLLCFQAYNENGTVIGQSFTGYTALASQFRITGADTEAEEDGSVIVIYPRTETDQTEGILYTYQIYDLQTQLWHTLQQNTSEPGKWKLWAPGNYWIHIEGKTGDGVESAYTMGYAVTGGASVTGIQVSPGSGENWNSAVLLSGSVSNPFGQKLEYEYLAYDGTYWKRILKTDTLEEAEFVPDKPGNYLLCFQVYDETGKLIGQSFANYNVAEPQLSIGNIETKAVKEKEIQVSLKGTETNDPEAEYRWMYYDLAAQTWGIIQDWSHKQEAVWKPKKFGNYWIHAEARTSAGATVSATIGYSVVDFYVKPGSLQVTTTDHLSYQIQLPVESNDPNLKYTYQIYDLRTEQWSVIGTSSSAVWTPAVSGDYWVHAVLTDSDGTTYEKTIGYGIRGYEISSLAIEGVLEPGKEVQLALKGTACLDEPYTFTYMQWGGSGWFQLHQSSSPDPVSWIPAIKGDYELLCQVTNQYGYVVDQVQLHIYPQDFMRSGWVYENGYKFYYINGEKQLDLEGILPAQSSYEAKVNRQTGTVTIYAADGNNGYIIPVKRFACSVGTASNPTPSGTYWTSDKERWHANTSGQYGQYASRIMGNIWFLSVEGDGMSSFNVRPEKYNQLGSPASTGNVCLSVGDAQWIYENCPSGMKVTIYDSADPGPFGRGQVISITDGNQNWDPTDNGAIYAAPFDSQAKEVMHNVIYAVETGGQIYGNARYDDFTEAYTNSSKETAITIGAGAWFATEAKNLLQRIRQADPVMFQTLDTENIAEDLANADWTTYGTDGKGNVTIQKGSAKAQCIQKIISSEVGKRVQDQLVDEQMERYVNYAAELGVEDLKAKMFCANVEHLGGYSAMEWVVEICRADGLPMTMDNLYRAMRAHTSNPNGVGADKYNSRHVKVMQWINQYIVSG